VAVNQSIEHSRQGEIKLLEISEDTQHDRLLDEEDAAIALKLSVAKVKQLVSSGELPSVKIGRSRRIRQSDLAAFIGGLK